MGAVFSGFLEVVPGPRNAWEAITALDGAAVLTLGPDNEIIATHAGFPPVRLNETTLKWEQIELSEIST